MDAKRLIKGTPGFNQAMVEVYGWANKRKFPMPEIQVLPETLIMIYHNNRPSSCGFLYKTDSQVCWLAWVISNPDIEKEARADALETLFSCAKVAAQTMGFDTVFTMSGHDGLKEKLSRHFTLGDSNAANYFWRG